MATTEILKTTNLQKSFSGIIAAEDINISVKEGEIIGIIGANGAGKTVFVNMITGYLKPTSGSIEFNGKNITGIKPREATHIGVCRSFQVSQVFMSMTVKQNLMIAMSLSKKSGSALLDPIDDDILSKECDKILKQYNIIKQKDLVVSTLSQGMRKLLDIAMAVVGNPKILLLDEPTSLLDQNSQLKVLQTIKNLTSDHKKPLSALWITHRYEELIYADAVAELKNGFLSSWQEPSKFQYN